MILKNQKIKKVLYLSVLLLVLSINFFMIDLSINQQTPNNSSNSHEYINDEKKEDIKSLGIVEDEFTEEWLDNGGFTSPATEWYNISSEDTDDVNATLQNNRGGYQILGNISTWGYYSRLGQDPDWREANALGLPSPDAHELNSTGGCAAHYWRETADQHVAVCWNLTIEMPEDMSDYNITAASIDVEVNATVQARDSVDDWGYDFTGAIDVMSDSTVDPGDFQGSEGDYVRYYILISDKNKIREFPVGEYKNATLGQDNPELKYLYDTIITAESESDFRYYLTQVLKEDNRNFTITVGMEIYCEDNFPQDADNWKLLVIKSLNLSITYQKLIDQSTSLSWNQDGNRIEGDNVVIKAAKLNFKYNISELWPASILNSELRILINGTQHSETVKLTSATLGDQYAKTGGFDVGYLIRKDVNISLSIQLFIADSTFQLDRIFTISIDDVSLNITYAVTTVETPTRIKIYLNGIDRSLDPSISIAWRENVNITITYINDTDPYNPISDATVDINGTGISEVLGKSGSYNHSILINTTELVFGVNNYLTIRAYKKYYETFTDVITIRVIERPTSLENIQLNSEERTAITMQYNEILNITVSYNDTLDNGNFIQEATVAINGSGISELLEPNYDQQYYTIEINTVDMDEIGTRFLTLTAEKDNFTLSSRPLTVTINLKETYLLVQINGTPITDFDYYNISLEETLNITAWFREEGSNAFIDGASLDLVIIGSDPPLPTIEIKKHPDYNQYNLTINTTDIGAGVRFLTITAQRENYSSSSEPTALIIQQKSSVIELYLDGVRKYDNDKIDVALDDIINVTVTFKDKISLNHLSEAGGADVNLIGFGGGKMDENIAYEFYNFSLRAYDLDEGITILTILAEMPNYVSSSIQFIIEVGKQQSNIELFFNGNNVTIDPSIEVPIGVLINFTVNFTDIDGNHIINANVTLGGAYVAELTELHNQYSILINTNQLELGINIISVTAYRQNYEYQYDNLRISLRKIRTSVDTDDGEDKIEIRPGESVTIVIELKENDPLYGFTASIEDADVTYDWKLEDGDLDEKDDGEYELILENVPEGTYTIEISVFKEGGRYDFETLEITLVVKTPAEDTFLIQLALIAAIIAGVVLAGYTIAYQKYLKYPKPVRKVRKYRRTLKRRKAPTIDIITREKAFKDLYSEELGKGSKQIKTKQIAKIDKSKQTIEKKGPKSLDTKTPQEVVKKAPITEKPSTPKNAPPPIETPEPKKITEIKKELEKKGISQTKETPKPKKNAKN